MRMSQELTKHTIWLHRIHSAEENNDDNKCPIYQENKRRLDLLLNELKVTAEFNNSYDKSLNHPKINSSSILFLE